MDVLKSHKMYWTTFKNNTILSRNGNVSHNEILKILVDFIGSTVRSSKKLLFIAEKMQFKTRVSTLATRICIIHTETRQIPTSFHYNPVSVGIFRGKPNGVREMFTVSVTFFFCRVRKKLTPHIWGHVPFRVFRRFEFLYNEFCSRGFVFCLKME